MMKKFIPILTILIIIFFSCERNLGDLNQNKKAANTIEEGELFVSAEKRLSDQINTANPKQNSIRHWIQHWQNTDNTVPSEYDFKKQRLNDNYWEGMYGDVLPNLKEVTKIIHEKDENLESEIQTSNKLAVVKILKAFVFSNLVENFGDIPYSEALNSNKPTPKFDDGLTVYKSILDSLDIAINELNSSEGSFDKEFDRIYKGNVEQWEKFGNTLRLRMGIVLADIEQDFAKNIVESAVANGVFESNLDDAGFEYSSGAPNNNPLNQHFIQGANPTAVVGKTILKFMTDLKDPRRGSYFAPNLNKRIGLIDEINEGENTSEIKFETLKNSPEINDLIYNEDEELVGIVKNVGSESIKIINTDNEIFKGDDLAFAVFKGGGIGEVNLYNNFTHPGHKLTEPDFPGYILTYDETEFLLAEALARGFNISGTIEDHYKSGITASFEKWNIPGLQDYLSQDAVDYNKAVENSNADEPWREVIGIQSWIAMWGRAHTPYLTIRRLDYPILTEPAAPDSGFPVRWIYPINEESLNEEHLLEAIDNIGGDAPETKLFWDKYDHNWF